MNRLRTPMLLLFSGVIVALVFLGAQWQAPVAFALPSFTSSNVSTPATNTCASCHSGAAASGGSAVVVFPSGTTYTPGGPAQSISVKITDPTHSRFGYLLTARLASTATSQGGSFTAADANSTVVANGAVQDIEAASFGQSTYNISWTPPATNVGNVTFFLTGLATGSPGGSTSGNGVYQSQATLTPAVAASPDFSLSSSAASVSIAQGASGSSTITVTPKNSFSGSVALAATGLPSGVTAAFSPASATTTSSLTLTASSSAAAGTSTVTITGTSGALTHTTTVSLTVTAAAPAPNFSLSASPNSLSVAQSASGTSTITVTPSNGFTGTVTFTASGTPSGVTATFASKVLTLAASSTAAAGTSTITITGTSGALTHTTTVSLTVTGTAPAPNFSLSASPNSLTVAQSASGSSTIAVTPLNGFTGTVAFSASGMPTGVTATFASNVLTLTASSTAAAGNSTVNITGTSGMLTHTATLSLTVSGTTTTGALLASPASLTFTFQRGIFMRPQSLNVTSNGSPVNFSVTTTGGPWLMTTPSNGKTPGTIMVFANPANMSQGTFSGMIYVNAPGASEKAVPVTLTVNSSTGCGDACGGGGGGSTMFAQPTVTDPNSTGSVAAMWVGHLGMPTGSQTSNSDAGLVLSKNAGASAGTQAGASTGAPAGVTGGAQAGAVIRNVQGSLTELGFDYRVGGQCTATSPRFIVVTTDNITHVVGGCSKGTSTAAPVMGWNRVRFNLADTTQTSPAITPGEQVSSLTLVMDEGPEAGSTAAGGLVILDNIDVNGTFAVKMATRQTTGDN